MTTTIVFDSEMCDRLGNADRCVQFRDASGRVIGYFTPARSMYEGVDSPASPDELKRRESEDGRELSGILADLQERVSRP